MNEDQTSEYQKKVNSEEMETKEIYAHYGLAIYLSNTLEHQIVNTLTLLEIFPKRKNFDSHEKSLNFFDENFEGLFKLTLGAMKGRLSSHMEEHKPIKLIVDDLKRTLKTRNFLVHDFFRVHFANWLSEKGRKEMLTILENAQKQFVASDEKLESFHEVHRKKYNIPDYSIEDGLKELVKNNPNGPFALTLCFCATCL